VASAAALGLEEEDRAVAVGLEVDSATTGLEEDDDSTVALGLVVDSLAPLGLEKEDWGVALGWKVELVVGSVVA
jgi:hypothetical protein